MRFIFAFPVLLFFSCKLPEKWIPGVYVNRNDDTIRLKFDHSFRVELLEPDTVDHKQQRFTSGRWQQVRRKLIFTVSTKSMGEYWQCVPFKLRFRHIKRPVECTEEGGKMMNFKKIHLRKKKHRPPGEKKSRKKKKGEAKEE